MNSRLATVAVLAAMLGGTSGCSGADDQAAEMPMKPPSSAQPEHSDHEHSHDSTEEPLVIITDDPMAEAGLVEYADESDLVLRGTVVAEEEGPQFEGMPPYTLLTVEPTAILKGEAPDGVKILMLTETESGRLIQLEGRPDDTGYESVWMLKAVDPMFNRPAGEYVLTGNAGLLPGDSQGAIDVGATEQTPAIVEAEEIGTIDQVEDVVASAE